MVHVCISRGLLLECGGVEVRGYIGFGAERSEVVRVLHTAQIESPACLIPAIVKP